jgi:hypothetical protein
MKTIQISGPNLRPKSGSVMLLIAVEASSRALTIHSAASKVWFKKQSTTFH